MKTSRKNARRGGMTLVEVMVSVSLFGLILMSLATVNRSGRQAYRAGSTLMDIEARGTRTIRRVVDALRLADLDSLSTVPTTPLSTSSVDFQSSLGFDGKQTEWSNPQRLMLDAATGQVLVVENPGLNGERSRAIGSSVPALLDGETLNGTDDNGNGLIDEAGLCFTRSGDTLTIRLSLAEEGPDGNMVFRSWTTSLFCRN